MAIRLYWWQENRADGKQNYGDLLSKYLVEKISNKKVLSLAHPKIGIQKYFFKNFLAIGSIITAASDKSIVWGSGIIKKNESIRAAKFLAVRGPRTRKRISDLGYKCPEIYGDPAILLPKFYNTSIEKKFKIGVIPHYIDYQNVYEALAQNKHIKVINLITDDIEVTTKEILECEAIVSSSLHGVIVPHAYKIPALWVKFSSKLSGDNVKFYDYFESMDINFQKELYIEPKELSIEVLQRLLDKYTDITLPDSNIIKLRQNGLLEVCPF